MEQTTHSRPAGRRLSERRSPSRFPTGKRLFAALASLRLAVVLLSLFAACLAGGTLIESRYGGRVAQDLVYRTWWFALLLLLLAGNVLCAALKKYPWKRHQTGFLITHAGLLVLVWGGLLTTLFGVEGQMVLIDTPDPAIQARVGLTDHADSIYLSDSHRIEVYRLGGHAPQDPGRLAALVRAIDRGEEVPEDCRDCLAGSWSLSFNPGPLAWYSDEHLALHLPWDLTLLYLLASPLPGYVRDLDGRATLTVNNFYPHAEFSPDGEDKVSPREVLPGTEAGDALVPALRCSLSAAGKTREFWTAMYRAAARVWVGDDFYLIRYRPDARPTDFTLTLRRARQNKAPGTDRSAGFESEVCVRSPNGRPEESRDHRIVMNHPFEDGLYKVYQTSYRALVDPRTGEPILDGGRQVSLSGLTVAYDPGLWFKYVGSLTVVLGIASMFYMRAYFFQPRSRRAPDEPTLSTPLPSGERGG
jgi:hypothetical protein